MRTTQRGAMKKKAENRLTGRSRSMRFLAVGLLVAASLAIGSGASAHSQDQQGVEQPISREDLPPGISEHVSDTAIEMANSVDFVEARSRWDDEDEGINFVDQIDYQLSFRSQADFLTSTPEHIAELMTRKPQNLGVEELLLYLSNAEAAEMQRRFDVGDLMPHVVEIVSGIKAGSEDVEPVYGPIFGGIWMDQLDGGRIVLAVTDEKSIDLDVLNTAVGESARLTIVVQEYSFDELETFKATLSSQLSRNSTHGFLVTQRTSRVGITLDVVVSDLSILPKDFGDGVPKNAYALSEGATPEPTSNPQSLHTYAQQQPGLAINVGAPYAQTVSACTWGHNGHTSSYNYLITAAHCAPVYLQNQNGWLNDVDFRIGQTHTPGALILTSSTSYVYAKVGYTKDYMRVSLAYADDNCYHAGIHCTPMKNRAYYNSFDLWADVSCASLGSSNVYRCGWITAENVNNRRLVAVGFASIGGDSGAGMKYANSIDGILVETDGNWSYFYNAYDVKNQLGFDFNCAPTIQYHFPSDWGTCPGIH